LSFLCLCLSHSCTQIGTHINYSHKTLQPERLRFVLRSTGLGFAAAAGAVDQSSSVSPCSTNESAHGMQALSLARSGEGFIQHWAFSAICTRSAGHKQGFPQLLGVPASLPSSACKTQLLFPRAAGLTRGLGAPWGASE